MAQGRLLVERRFAFLFWTQFLGAFNDNVFKNALILLFTLDPPRDLPLGRDELVNVASGLLVLPFFLFSATAGQLAEKLEKSRLIRATKLVEVVLMVCAAAALHGGSGIALLALLFCMGLQSALFGPVKFSVLPQLLRENELVGGNGLIEMGTYVAILGGMMIGGTLVAIPEWGRTAVAGTVVTVAVAGWLTSRGVPTVPSAAPDLRISWNFLRETVRVVGLTRERRAVFLSVLGNSWFWLFGALVLAQLPGFVEDVLHGTPAVVTLLLVVFSVGVGIGSLLCEKLSGRHIELGLVPFGSIGMTLFALDLFFATEWYARPSEAVEPLQVLATGANWRWLLDLLFIGVFGGFYSVPLNAIIQHRSEDSKRSRIIAGNNVLNALFMVAAAGLGIVCLGPLGMSIPQVFLVAAVLNAAVAVYIYTLLPEFLMRFLVWLLMHTVYRLRVEGEEHIPDEGPAVLVCNHVSYVDALVIAAGCRRPIRFVMWYKIFQIPVLSFVFRTARAIPIASRKEDPALMERAFEEIDRAIADGDLVCIFPEGGLTRDGEIGPFRPGVERILEKNPVPVIPMALRGLWGSWFSRRGGAAMAKRPRRFWSKVELRIGRPVGPAAATAAALREEVLRLRGDWK
jgi:1-acyl-sn-glycerol-3-phosphate acyltransferase